MATTRVKNFLHGAKEMSRKTSLSFCKSPHPAKGGDDRMTLEAFAGSNGGQTTAEYALLLGVITLPLILVLSEFGLTRVRLFEAIVRALMP